MLRATFLGSLFVGLGMAGCIMQEAESLEPTIEAFEATYQVAPTDRHPAVNVTVSLHGPAPYLAADGSRRDGYIVDVDWGELAVQRSRPQTVLGASFEVERNRWCNGWANNECQYDQYDWQRGSVYKSLRPEFGIAMNIAPPENATRSEHGGAVTMQTEFNVYEFSDGKLAPTKILAWPQSEGEIYATRTSYDSTGTLGGLTEQRPADLPREPVIGSVFPGADTDPFGQGFSLAEAVAFLRSERTDAASILASGGCVRRTWSFVGPTNNASLPPIWADRTTQEVHITLVNANESRDFGVAWGQRALNGEYGFLEATDGGRSVPWAPMDCTRRSGSAVPLASSYELAQSFTTPADREYYAFWWSDYGDRANLVHRYGTNGPQVYVDATAGGLSYVHHVPVDHEIDS